MDDLQPDSKIGLFARIALMFRHETHKLFVGAEHFCALGYAICEFYNLHIMLLVGSATLLAGLLLVVLNKLIDVVQELV